jgi:hypothetical protein
MVETASRNNCKANGMAVNHPLSPEHQSFFSVRVRAMVELTGLIEDLLNTN